MLIRPFGPGDEDAIVELWHACGLAVPWNDPRTDIATHVNSGRGPLLVLELDGAIVGTAMAGFDGHRGWIYYLGVAAQHRRHGHATALVRAAEAALAANGCPKVNLMVRGTNAAAIGFYETLGYAVSDVITLGRRIND